MEPQYVVKDGLLVSLATPKSKKPIFGITLIIFLFSLLAFFGFILFNNYYSLPKGSFVLSKAEYEDFVEIEQELKALRAMHGKEFVINRQSLEIIFNNIFAEVKISEAKKDRYLDSILNWSNHYAIPAVFVMSIIWRESTFDEKTVSSANARGPMQVIYKYHVDKFTRIGKTEQDLHDIDTGIRIGVEVVREYYDRYDRDIYKALTAYVGGEHRSYAKDIMNKYMNAQIYICERINNGLK